MLKTLRDAFKIKELRDRIIFTFLMLVVVRIGSLLPVPGADTSYFASFFAKQSGDAFNFFDAFTGGSFSNLSVFALSITPYITSSIIIQILTIAIPKLEEMQKEGEDGRKKLTQITRYLTVALALIESTAMAIGFGGSGLIANYSTMGSVEKVLAIFIIVAALTAGSAVLMWIGERITEKGVGNGISIVLLINIISRAPDDIKTLWDQFIAGKTLAKGLLAAAIIVAVIILMVVFVCVLQGGERRIPVQYAQKVQGRRMVGGQSTNIPLKVNTAGVIPIIFASSLMQFPVVIASFFTIDYNTIGGKILRGLSSSNWCKPSEPVYSIGLLVYIVLVVFFAYFYTSITFNPLEVANNMKKQGGFIPGIRPGKSTTDYLTSILNYLIFVGVVGLIIVAIIPIIFTGLSGATVSFGGTSLIIIVGVILETIKQIESKMVVRNYKGFLNN